MQDIRFLQVENIHMDNRKDLKNKKRIVVKIGSSSLFHPETGKLNFRKMERLVRVLADLSNTGKDIILVSSGAISTGRNGMGLDADEVDSIPMRQACAAIGQAQLISVYQRMFAEYGKTAAQVLLTRYTIHSEHTRVNAANTFDQLLKLGVIPVVNENDTVTTEEIEFGDNDCLSAMVGVLAGADLLIIMSDIDGLYDSNPRENPDAKLIRNVESIDDDILKMGESTPGTSYGTGGMVSKLEAAGIATHSGIDMVIINAEEPYNILKAIEGEEIGTFFAASGDGSFKFEEFKIID